MIHSKTRQIALIVSIIFFMPSMSHGQRLIEQIERYVRENQISKVQDKLPEAIEKYPDHPTVLYCRGLLAQDASVAFHYYNQIFDNHKSSPFCDDALLRMGKFYTAQERHDMAAKYFSYLSTRYADSPLKDESLYLYCQAILAQGWVDSARTLLTRFVKFAPRSPFADLAILDLESSHEWENYFAPRRVGKSDLPETKYGYSLQLGAFKDRQNAQNLKEKFDRLGYDVEIVRISRSRENLYAVWLGKFETRALAQNFAVKNREDVGSNFRVVEREH